MILKIFTVYDSKAEAYLQPFYMQSKGAAVRAFADSCNDPQSQFFKHPEDFTLFELGEYDDSTAKITSHQTLKSIGLALEFKNSDNNRIKGVQAVV